MNSTVFEKLIVQGKSLMFRTEKQVRYGIQSLPEAEWVVEGEGAGWLKAAATAVENTFGPDSPETRNYHEEMKALTERVNKWIERGHKSAHGDWTVYCIGYAIGLLAPYQYHKVTPDTEESSRSVTFHVRDQYLALQAGAMGPQAHASYMTFQQIWSQNQADLDLTDLAQELNSLRESMRNEAKLPKHDLALGEVAAAQTAAEAGDGPRALQHLKNAGKWALDTATKIGVNVATAAIKAAMGL